MPTVQANGCNFYYELAGHGPDLVFIHGEIHGLEYWEYQIPEFARAHRCFAYNRRGHAKTELTRFGFSLVNQTRDLASLIDALGIELGLREHVPTSSSRPSDRRVPPKPWRRRVCLVALGARDDVAGVKPALSGTRARLN